jgi:hypothetical protein
VSSVHVGGDVVGYFRKLDLPTAMPMGSEKLPGLIIDTGTQTAIGTADVVLPHNGSCLVTCNINVEANALNSTGYLSIRTARRDVAGVTINWDDGWEMDIPLPSRYGSASTTYTWSMRAGMTYRFGCFINAAVDFIGETVGANVSWICR